MSVLFSRSRMIMSKETCLVGMAHGYRTSISPTWMWTIPFGSFIVSRSNHNSSFPEMFFNKNTSPMEFSPHQRDFSSYRFAKKRWEPRCSHRSSLNQRLSCQQVHPYYTEYQYDLYEKSEKIASIALANGQKLPVSTIVYSNSDSLFVSVHYLTVGIDFDHC